MTREVCSCSSPLPTVGDRCGVCGGVLGVRDPDADKGAVEREPLCDDCGRRHLGPCAPP